MTINQGARRRPSLTVAITGAACLAVLGLVPAATTSATTTGYQEYVALGDSYVAGAGLVPLPSTDFVNPTCAQMPYDYPRQVAAALDVPVFRDASCSGATNVHMISAQNGIPGGGNPPQFNMLTPTTDLVTLGIGNNDLRIAEAILGPCLSVLPININDACKKAVE